MNQLERIKRNIQISNLKALIERINNTSNANFVQRLKDPNRKSINDWSGENDVATHRLSYVSNNGYDVVYPEVQELDGELYDFTDPKNKRTWREAYKSAAERGDSVHVPSSYGEVVTKNYKPFYPSFKKGGLIRKSRT